MASKFVLFGNIQMLVKCGMICRYADKTIILLCTPCQTKKSESFGFKMSSSFPHSMRSESFDKIGRKSDEISKTTIQETSEELIESEIFENHTKKDKVDGVHTPQETKVKTDDASHAKVGQWIITEFKSFWLCNDELAF